MSDRKIGVHSLHIMPDVHWPNMWRVRWPDGRLSDLGNLTRIKDAAACFVETLERKRRGRHSPRNARGRLGAEQVG